MLPKIYGRKDSIEQIVDRIDENISTLIILGPPGIGKTFVANAVVYEDRVIKRFGVRRHWADLALVTSLESFRDVLYESLASDAPTAADISSNTTFDHPNISPDCLSVSSMEDRLSTSIDTLRKSAFPRLLVLNDLDHAWDRWRSDGKLILQELCTIPQLTVLITMRGATELPQVGWRLEMTALSPWDAKLLFLTIYPNSDYQLDALLQKVHYLPQAVTYVAHVCEVNQIKPSELLRRRNQGQSGFLQLQDENLDDLDTSISSWVDNASEQVSPEAQKFLRILSMLPDGALHNDLQYLVPGISDVHEITRILTNTSLASIYRGTRLQLLAPVRSHYLKYHELDEPSRRELYSHYFELAKEGLCRPGDRRFSKVVEKLVKEQRNVEAILKDALDRRCIIAIEATLQYSAPWCAFQPRMDIVEKALELARETCPKSLQTGRCLQRLGDMYMNVGGYNTGSGFLGEAVCLFNDLEEPVAAAECEIGIAEGIWINKHEAAVAHLERTQKEFFRLGDVPGQARCSLVLGKKYVSIGRMEEARSTIEDSLSKFIELSDRHSAVMCELALAEIHLDENRLDDARYALPALDTLQSFGDRSAIAKAQRILASLLIHEGREEDARSPMRKSLEELEWLGHNLDAAFTMWWLAAIAEDDEAIELLQRAIPIFWNCCYTFAGAECRLDLGLRYMVAGRYTDALPHLEIARPELQANETHTLAAFCRAAIIVCLRRDNQVSLAELATEAHRDELFSAARKRDSPRWRLCVIPADDIANATAREDQILYMVFQCRSRLAFAVTDRPRNCDIPDEELDRRALLSTLP